MEPIPFALLATACVMGGMTLLWLVSLILRDSGIVDVFWGMAFVIVAWLGVAAGTGALERRWVLAMLVSVWGLRLCIRIGRRNLGKPEDFRYAAWREAAGPAWWWRSLFKVFWLQGAVAMVVALPLLAGATGTTPATLTPVDLLGIAVWMIGFAFEAIGDLQLDRFRADPSNRGTILDTGLWRWSRHPNYFGDALLWWGFGIIAVLTPMGLPALLGPALMSFLLIKVSGVAMLERAMSTRPGWDAYASRTNAFLPRPPRGD
jgi:steroid 5-alpha reductase family enzyme